MTIKLDLHWKILIALILAVVAGSLSGTDTTLFGINFYSIYKFVGTLFLNALSMLIMPLVIATIIHGVGAMAGKDDFARLGGLTVVYFIGTSLVATLIGMVFTLVLQPGLVDGMPTGTSLGLNADPASVDPSTQGAATTGATSLANIVLGVIPPNVFEAATQGQLLGVIFFSILFGYFMTRIPGEARAHMQGFWHGAVETIMQITLWVMKFAPYGIFGIVAATAATTGLEAFRPFIKFFMTCLVIFAFHSMVFIPLLLKFVGKVSPIHHAGAVLPALLTAFSTSSSSATLPVTLECVQSRAGVSEETASLVLPLGATMNMDGSAAFYGAAPLFVAQAYGMDVTTSVILTVLFISVIGSVGIPGIPGIPLILPVILATLGLPLEAVAMLYSIDRVLDMLRTVLNVYGDTCGAVIIARLRGEQIDFANT